MIFPVVAVFQTLLELHKQQGIVSTQLELINVCMHVMCMKTTKSNYVNVLCSLNDILLRERKRVKGVHDVQMYL